jgi:hypothetical protein
MHVRWNILKCSVTSLSMYTMHVIHAERREKIRHSSGSYSSFSAVEMTLVFGFISRFVRHVVPE